MSEVAPTNGNEERLCCICRRCTWEPARAEYLVAGRRWSEAEGRYIPFRGYVCEMHAAEDCRDCRIVKSL